MKTVTITTKCGDVLWQGPAETAGEVLFGPARAISKVIRETSKPCSFQLLIEVDTR